MLAFDANAAGPGLRRKPQRISSELLLVPVSLRLSGEQGLSGGTPLEHIVHPALAGFARHLEAAEVTRFKVGANVEHDVVATFMAKKAYFQEFGK